MGLSTIDAYRAVTAELTGPGAAFEIESVDAGGWAMRVYRDVPRNLAELYDKANATYGAKVLVREGAIEWSYGDIALAARRFAHTLVAEHRIAVGDNVGIAMRNRAEWLVAFMAVTSIGGVAVLFNSRGSRDELAHAAAQVPCRLVVADDRRLVRLHEAGVSAPLVEIDVAAILRGDAAIQPAIAVEPDDPAAILFTSGTTGRPKGAVLSHRTLGHTARNLQFMREVGLALNAKLHGVPVETLRQMAPEMSSILVFPLFHVSGLISLFMSLTTGGEINTMPRWDPAEALRIIEENKVTLLSGPALVLTDLLDQPDAAARMARIVNAGVGGQATPASLAERIARLLPGAQPGNGWGMTELAGSACAATGALLMARPQSCGPLFPVVDMCTVGEDGEALPPGSVGELCVRGPLVMTGYYNAPGATAEALRDGWLHSGDIGRIDEDGFVYLVDRKKDMVISAGENIYCAEVERVLSASEKLREVALFGVPDERLGERAVAAVTLREGETCEARELLDLTRRQLADYKVPSEILFDLGPLPRNVIGKIDKNALRDRYLSHAAERA
jgi:acyl-CoA synthetase (AMP-forming)/AMP-acid ligase II